MIDIMRLANRTKDYTAIDNTFSNVKNLVGLAKAGDEQLNGEISRKEKRRIDFFFV